jgi:hypothetical protein
LVDAWVVLNGADLTGHHLHREGRLELTNLARENTLVVEAEFAYAETGTGLYRFGDTRPAGASLAAVDRWPERCA